MQSTDRPRTDDLGPEQLYRRIGLAETGTGITRSLWRA
jgi:hypothetical protein